MHSGLSWGIQGGVLVSFTQGTLGYLGVGTHGGVGGGHWLVSPRRFSRILGVNIASKKARCHVSRRLGWGGLTTRWSQWQPL